MAQRQLVNSEYNASTTFKKTGIMLESNAKQIELICNGRGYLKKKKTPIKKMEIAGPLCERLGNEIVK